MPYTSRIKTLEESYRVVDNQLFQLEKTGAADPVKLASLQETRAKYLNELRELRRKQWDHDQSVDFGDDR